MKEYHKIPTVFKRDPDTNFKTLLENQFAEPELEYLQRNKWIFTEKVDGTNIRIIFNNRLNIGGELAFGGKTDNAQIPAFLLNKLNDLFFPLKSQLAEMFNDGVCLYGEGYGAKIQKGGGNYRQDQSIVIFDIKIGEWWLQRKDIEDITKTLNLEIIPIIGEGTLYDMISMAKKGFKSRWGDFRAEGIVARPTIELKARNGKRIITKIKYKDFENEIS